MKKFCDVGRYQAYIGDNKKILDYFEGLIMGGDHCYCSFTYNIGLKEITSVSVLDRIELVQLEDITNALYILEGYLNDTEFEFAERYKGIYL